jgi:hypothetical protein
MIYYKYLDLNWQPAARALQQYVSEHPLLLDATTGSWKTLDLEVLTKMPEIQAMFEPLNLTIKYLALFVTIKPAGNIHIDYDPISKCRINFPVLNCEQSETRFFINHGPLEEITQSGRPPYILLNQDACVFADKFCLSKPAVIRIKEPHQVVSNNSVQPRISCTVAFHQDIEYLLH